MASKEKVAPSENKLVTTSNEILATEVARNSELCHPPPVEKVHMKKQLGLLEGVAIILGIIFGSGIFISPKGVVREVEAVGTSLIIWVLSGILSMIGALCYAELGTSIPKSGGDYAYIYEAFGSLPAFLYLWDAMMIFVPTTNAIMGLTVASYVMQPFFPEECKIPDCALQLLAAVIICFLTYLNSYSMKVTTKMQNIIMFTKVAALVLIIILGLVWIGLGNIKNFEKPFDKSVTDPGKLSVAIYSGIFSYAGWNYLNFMTEELRDPYKNLPRAIYISLPLVTAIYVLANLSYLAVLTPQEMVASEAIAVTFGKKILGVWSLIIPILVAVSAFGGLSVHIMASSRMCFVGARNGHMPSLLSHISIDKYTPTPSLVFLRKRDNAKQTGFDGGSQNTLDEVDKVILDILESDSAVVDGLNLSESYGNSENPPTADSGSRISRMTEPDQPQPPNSRKRNSFTKFTSETLDRERKCRLEFLEVEVYHRKLQCLKLERELQLPLSNFTSIISPDISPVERNISFEEF